MCYNSNFLLRISRTKLIFEWVCVCVCVNNTAHAFQFRSSVCDFSGRFPLFIYQFGQFDSWSRTRIDVFLLPSHNQIKYATRAQKWLFIVCVILPEPRAIIATWAWPEKTKQKIHENAKQRIQTIYYFVQVALNEWWLFCQSKTHTCHVGRSMLAHIHICARSCTVLRYLNKNGTPKAWTRYQ